MRASPVLECQTCGRVLTHLTPEQERMVADNPRNFIIDCNDCRIELERIERGRPA